MNLFVTFLILPLLTSATIAFVDKSNVSSYWTAYLNISYVDKDRQVWHTERTETGRFSSSGAKEAAGVAVEITSEDDPEDRSGCTLPFRKTYPSDQKWIAIIERGKCTFNQKISNALSVNASGVLIYDNEDDGILQSMKVEERFPIPSVFTYQWKGKEILKLMRTYSPIYINLQEGSFCRTHILKGDKENKNHKPKTMLYCTESDIWDDISQILRKSPGSPFWPWNVTRSNSGSGSSVSDYEKRTSVLFVSISFIVLMLISLAWLVFYYVQRFRYIHAKDRLERKLCTQAKRALNIISTSVLKKDDLEMKDFSETCAVCIETYRVADVVRILPCKHQFHKACIDQWLLEKRTCPMCKMDILKHYGFVEDDPGSDVEEQAALSLS